MSNPKIHSLNSVRKKHQTNQTKYLATLHKIAMSLNKNRGFEKYSRLKELKRHNNLMQYKFLYFFCY